MNQLSTSTFEKPSEDLLYYNISIRGSDNPEEVIAAKFSENRTDVILENPSEWIVGMVRFYVPGLYIPIFKWGTQEPAPLADPNLKIYFTFGGVTVTEDVAFIPQGNDPFPVIGRLVWNFTDFIDMVNVAIATAFATIALEVGFPTTAAPRLVYDATTKLISLFTEATMNSVTSGVRFGMSNLLYSFFPSFPVFEEAIAYSPSFVYFLTIDDNLINNITYAGVPGYRILQEYTTIALWSNVNKLLFESNSIPINQELEQSQTNIQRRVVFDFVISDDQLNDRSAIIYYNEGGQRWADLLSQFPMKKMDMSVNILFDDGTVQPLRLNSVDNLTAKIEFRKKKPGLLAPF